MISVIVVIFCFFTMVVFLLRLRGFSPTSVTWVSRNRAPQQMALISNPFVFKLTNIKDSSLSGVDCTISSEVCWIYQDLWGVQISNLHQILSRRWHELKSMMHSGTLLKDSCICRGAVKSNDACDEELIPFSPPKSISANEMGNVTRSVYPLVVCMVQESDEISSSDSVVALISIIHIKDEILTFGTLIISQYLKLSSGQVFVLQPLYGLTQDGSEDSSEDYSLCIVCQIKTVSVALLPCRHVCVCHLCLLKLDKCPMCREVIQCHFLINNESASVYEEDDTSDVQTTTSTDSLTLSQRFAHYNERLNELLGFT